jgi:DNA polymerase-1
MAAPFRQCGDLDLWSMDFEWYGPAGCLPRARTFTAIQRGTGNTVQFGEKELFPGCPPPFPITDHTIVASFSIAADMVPWRVLGWPLPPYRICTYTEHKIRNNGHVSADFGDDLVGAAAKAGIVYLHADVKKRLQQRYQDPAPLTTAENAEGVAYCLDDSRTGLRILETFLPDLWWERALFYGDYADTCAEIEFVGLPTDEERVRLFLQHRERAAHLILTGLDHELGQIMRQLQPDLDPAVDLRVFDDKGHMPHALIWNFAQCIKAEHPQFQWPKTKHGRPVLEDDELKAMGARFPIVEVFRQLRKTRSALRSNEFGIDGDGRCHCSLFPFGTITGRNAPKGKRFPFAFPAWMRGLIRAKPGWAIAYLDFASEEFAIAAWLSGDRNMQAVYLTGDPYLAMGVLLGLAPKNATKRSHKATRELCKVLTLGISYGMTAGGLARRAGVPESEAEELLRRCYRAFPVFHEWANDQVSRAKANHHIETEHGWEMYVERNANLRSLRNWLMQSTGSDILRLVALALRAEGVRMVALIHDAVLIECLITDLDDTMRRACRIMQRASEEIIGFPIRVDTGDDDEPHLFPYPARFRDKREGAMYARVFEILRQVADAAPDRS